MEELTYYELEEIFEESFNDAHGPLLVAGMEKNHAQVLKKVDNTAYRMFFNDWLDAEIECEAIFEKDGLYYVDNPDELDEDEEE